MVKVNLKFLSNEAGEREGLADAGIETFRDAPYASCAREAGQNARDAFERLPVRMIFNVRLIGAEELPAHEELVEAVTAALRESIQDKEIEFFRNALKVLRDDRIPVLEIADFNTKGLVGPPNTAGTPFHSLLKSSGVSVKESATAGGSFGIGKNASFAVSDMQMVLYSTLYSVDGVEAFAAQGKVKLASHTSADGSPRRATGYWGNPDSFAAVIDVGAVPQWMRRTDIGTSIFVVGFRESQDWAEHMTASLVANFFAAVQREEMIFEVDGGRIAINRNTIEHLLARDDVQRAAEASGGREELQFAGQRLARLVSPNAQSSEIAVPGAGLFSLRPLIQEGMPRRVGFVRNGMYITDNLKLFNEPLTRFPGSREFVALVEPANADAGEFLKKLENPEHNNFSAERLPSPQTRAVATTAMRALARKLREAIKQSTAVETVDSVVLDELGQFFAAGGRRESTDLRASRDPETYVYSPPRPAETRRPPQQTVGGTSGGKAGSGRSAGGVRGAPGPVPGGGSGGAGRRGPAESVRLTDLRNTIQREAGAPASRRTLRFTPDVSGKVKVRVLATGVNVPESLRVVATDRGVVTSEGFNVDVEAGQRTVVRVTFAEPYDGSIDVSAVASDSEGTTV